MPSKEEVETRWALRVLSSRAEASSGELYALGGGRQRIGADPENEICFDVRGVSRFHAALFCHANFCELEDLSSKNGTTVNGRPIKREEVRAGDVLVFASVRTLLELLPAGDQELALEFATPPPIHPGTTYLGTLAGESGNESLSLALFRCLRALEECFRHRAEPDYAGAAEVLVRHLGLKGVQVIELPRGGGLRVLASLGQMPELPSVDALRAAPALEGDPAFRYLRLPGGGLTVVRREKDGTLLGLALESAMRALLLPAQIAVCLLPFGSPAEEEAEPESRTSSALALAPGIVAGGSAAMKEVYRQVALIAPSSVPVLIVGETGVGKEHLARALHEHSPRRDQAFIAINCAAIPAELLEAEMFGIGQGVATGVKARRGRFLEADGGTLFLDEIGDMPSTLQSKLLRVLQENEITPIGEKSIKINVRVVAASHTDFTAAIADRHFREDLFYRLAGYVLQVPPLRERLDDLPMLLGRFLHEMAREAGRSVRGVTVKAIEDLSRERWPGNIRQLQQVARRLVFLCPRGQAVDSRLVAEALAALPKAAPPAQRNEFQLGEQGLEDYLGEIEKTILLRALEEKEGNRTRAAALLGISRNGLTRRLERYGISSGDEDQ